LKFENAGLKNGWEITMKKCFIAVFRNLGTATLMSTISGLEVPYDTVQCAQCDIQNNIIIAATNHMTIFSPSKQGPSISLWSSDTDSVATITTDVFEKIELSSQGN
jgi:hypothetical protein